MEFKRCLGCMQEHEGKGPCPHCGFDIEKYEVDFHQLRPGTILNGKYILGKVLGEGGFGISYLGWDLNLEYKVAVKEYYPVNDVTRQAVYTPTVTVLSGGRQEFYQKGLGKFVEEARSLAKFSEMPGIVHVRDYFQENGTAYIVMEFAEGDSLKNLLLKSDGRFPAEHVFEIMRPVIESLDEVHKKGLIHRDISPDNMMVSPKGQVKLLDFGAARNYVFGEEKSLSIILKPGYTPAEQYSTRGDQGPWTDVYALCATMYRAITGVAPPESLDRMNGDELKAPSSLGVVITPQQEAALMKGLAIHKEDRFGSMSELKNALYQRNSAPPPESGPIPNAGPVPASDSTTASDPQVEKNKHPQQKLMKKGKWMKIAAAAAVVVMVYLIGTSHILNRKDTETALSEEDFKFSTKTEWTSENGNQYEGFQNEDGLPVGTGKVTFANGDQYEGYFVDGYRQGHGKYTWENGTKYVGNYVNGEKSGFGILDMSDTDQIYIGEWKNNQREGLGILYDKKETYEMGVWKENKRVEIMQGVQMDDEDCYVYISDDESLADKAVISYSSGLMYIGEINEKIKKRDGWGVEISPKNLENFEYSEGIFRQDNNVEGILNIYKEDGDVISYMLEGKMNGPAIVKVDGYRIEGFMESGKEVGNWIGIDGDDGSVIAGTFGEDDKIVSDSEAEQWIQGEKMCIGIRKNGKVEGEHVVIEKDGLCAVRNAGDEFLLQFPSSYDGTNLVYFIWGSTTDSGKEWADGVRYAYMMDDGRTGVKVYKNGKWEQEQ